MRGKDAEELKDGRRESKGNRRQKREKTERKNRKKGEHYLAKQISEHKLQEGETKNRKHKIIQNATT